MSLSLFGGLAAALCSVAPGSTEAAVSPVHYDLSYDIDFRAESLEGVARIPVANVKGTATSEVPLLLYRLMTVARVTDGEGRALAFDQDVVRMEGLDKLQVNAVCVRLASPVAPGGTAEIDVRFSGRLLGYSESRLAFMPGGLTGPMASYSSGFLHPGVSLDQRRNRWRVGPSKPEDVVPSLHNELGFLPLTRLSGLSDVEEAVPDRHENPLRAGEDPQSGVGRISRPSRATGRGILPPRIRPR